MLLTVYCFAIAFNSLGNDDRRNAHDRNRRRDGVRDDRTARRDQTPACLLQAILPPHLRTPGRLHTV